MLSGIDKNFRNPIRLMVMNNMFIYVWVDRAPK